MRFKTFIHRHYSWLIIYIKSLLPKHVIVPDMIACYTNDKSKLPKEKATLSFCPKGGWWWNPNFPQPKLKSVFSSLGHCQSTSWQHLPGQRIPRQKKKNSSSSYKPLGGSFAFRNTDSAHAHPCTCAHSLDRFSNTFSNHAVTQATLRAAAPTEWHINIHWVN